MLGVLGGMGPLATADFLRKLVEATPAERDQDHLETITLTGSSIPDRLKALAGTGPDPLPAMIAGVRRLEAAGATRIVIPCNTAHHWHAGLQAETRLPVLHVVDAVLAALARKAIDGGLVGLIATTLTVETGLYQNRLAAHGFTCHAPIAPDEVMRAIKLVKAGRLGEAAPVFRREAEALLARGCRQVILACTEVPPALASEPHAFGPHLIDATDALAERCVAICLLDRAKPLTQAA